MSARPARRHAVDMTARRRLPMALRDASFRVRDALHRGVSRGRLDARDLIRPFHGIRSGFPPVSVEERARALAPRLRPDQVFSHVTAAAIIGVPLPRRLERDQRLHVTTIGTDQAIRVRGTVGHRARYGSVRATIARGVSLTTPADTFVALGSMLTLDELIVAGDALVGWLGWTTLDELAQAVRRRRGIRGIVKLRFALDEIRKGSRSPERPGHGWHSSAADSRNRRSTTMSSSTASGSHVWTSPTPMPGSRSSTRAICTAPIQPASGRTSRAASTSRTSTGGSSEQQQTTSVTGSSVSCTASVDCSRSAPEERMTRGLRHLGEQWLTLQPKRCTLS